MAKRGISEKIVYAHNPLPDVTEAELFEMVKLDLIEPSTAPPHQVRWSYAIQQDRENVYLAPGCFVPLRVSESRAFLQEHNYLGLVVVEDPEDREEVLDKGLKGLRIALKRYKEFGAAKVRDLMRQRGLTREDTDEHRHDYYPYWRNEASAELVAEKIKSDQRELRELRELRALEREENEEPVNAPNAA